MKNTILSLSMMGLAAFALCNCAAKGTNRAAVQSSVNTVPATADFAPQSVKGKTIIFNYDNATEDTEDVSENKVHHEKGVTGSVPVIISLTFGANNSSLKSSSITRNDFQKFNTGKYEKQSNSSAKIECDNGVTEFTYILKFTSPHSGTAIRLWSEGYNAATAKGITFTIK